VETMPDGVGSPRAAPALGLRAGWSERRRLRPSEGASAGQAGAFRPHSRLAAGFALELRRHRRDPLPRRAVASLCVVQWREWRGRQRTRRRSRHGHGPTIGGGRALGGGRGECVESWSRFARNFLFESQEEELRGEEAKRICKCPQLEGPKAPSHHVAVSRRQAPSVVSGAPPSRPTSHPRPPASRGAHRLLPSVPGGPLRARSGPPLARGTLACARMATA